MNAVAAGQIFLIDSDYEHALRWIRSALAEMELDIAAELDLAGFFSKPARKKCHGRVLLVDCPLLLFEALALDRAAGVYFPAHIVVSADVRRTHVEVVDPTSFGCGRLPAGAADPLARLQARIGMALDTVVQRCESARHEQ